MATGTWRQSARSSAERPLPRPKARQRTEEEVPEKEMSRRSFVSRAAAVAATAAAGEALAASAQPPQEPGPLRRAMDRAARCCIAWLDPANGYRPTGGYEPAHDTGRWWDAMLRYEAATGVRVPPTVESAMMDNLRALTDNPAALLASDLCNPHNLRESLLAYTALARWRSSEWAVRQGRTLVRAIAELLDPDGQMRYAELAKRIGKPLTDDPLMVHRSPAGAWYSATGSTGRAIEGLVLFHEVSGDAEALRLAKRLAEAHVRHVLDPSGKVRRELLAPDHVGHTHSYLGTLRGVLLLGIKTGEKRYVKAVATTYREGLWGTSVSYSGWTPHDQGRTRFPDDQGDPLGEHASCGDVAQLALWLGLDSRQTELLDDAERLVRARLLPSQMADPSNPRNDGAWGAYAHGFERGSIIDVIAAVLHTLCDVQERAVAVPSRGAVTVHLNLSVDAREVQVRSERGAEAALRVTLSRPRALRIRVPGWAPRSSVRLRAGDRALPVRWSGGYVTVDRGAVVPGVPVVLTHALPECETQEELPVSRRRFRLRWRGDDVVGCDPPVPIYLPAQAR